MIDHLGDADLARWQAVCDAAPGGEWKAEHGDHGCHLVRWCRDDEYNESGQDWERLTTTQRPPLWSHVAELCALSRTAMPALIAEVRRLRVAGREMWDDRALVIQERDKLRAENESLKAALDTIIARHTAACAERDSGAETIATLSANYQKVTDNNESLRAQSESWRLAHRQWQDWASDYLHEIGEQPKHGELGDRVARDVIGEHLAHLRQRLSDAKAEMARLVLGTGGEHA